MLWVTRIVIVLVVLLIGVALYGLFYLAGWLFIRFYRSQCPRCGKRGLQIVGGARATTRIDGKRAPDSWTVYQCDKCGAVLRWRRGKWEEMPADYRSGMEMPLR
jgi:uncharacterized protein with PIN domain